MKLAPCPVVTRSGLGLLTFVLTIGPGIVLPGCGDGTSQEWDVQRRHTLAGEALVEAELVMTAGGAFTAAFAGNGAALQWNVHSHGPGGDAVNHIWGAERAGSFRFVAPGDGTYWGMWVNRTDSPVTVDFKIDLEDGASWSRWID
jgi:hypothetical protein